MTATKEERPTEAVAAALYDERDRVIGVALVWGRQNEYASTVVEALNAIYGKSPWSDGQYRDAAGLDSYGLDVDGFDAEGINPDTGLNREGRDRNGDTPEESAARLAELRKAYEDTQRAYATARDAYNAANLTARGW